MPRAALTLAASVTAAVHGSQPTTVSELTDGGQGRFDTVLAMLADGRRVVVRSGVDADAVAEQRADARALEVLTAGVRALLPFAVPEVLGVTETPDGPVVVTGFIEGYRVEAGDIPGGRGIATSLGEAFAAVHDLPIAIVRDAGLPVRSAEHVRSEHRRVVERAEASGRLPSGLADRWRRAIEDDELWQFEATVIHGETDGADIIYRDIDDVPSVAGVLGWQALSVGDPASDLRWLSSAPDAVDDVWRAYAERSRRAPDPGIGTRARLYAELEFAKWLLHGIDVGDESVIADAESLLDSLGEVARGDTLAGPGGVDLHDAIALLERTPDTTVSSAADTSMQTDTYDPGMLDDYLPREHSRDGRDGALPTVPVDLSEWTGGAHRSGGEGSGAQPPSAPAGAEPEPEDTDLDAEGERASRAALRRWSERG